MSLLEKKLHSSGNSGNGKNAAPKNNNSTGQGVSKQGTQTNSQFGQSPYTQQGMMGGYPQQGMGGYPNMPYGQQMSQQGMDMYGQSHPSQAYFMGTQYGQMGQQMPQEDNDTSDTDDDNFSESNPVKERHVDSISKKQMTDATNSALLQGRLKSLEEEKKNISEAVEKEITKITDEERVLVDKVTAIISERFKQKVSLSASISDSLAKEIEHAVAIECERLNVLYEVQQRVKKTVISQIIGLGPLDPYMADGKVTEIIVQRWDHICIEREGKIYNVQATFTDERHLQTVIQRIVQPIGRQINVSRPIVDARLADGSRVCATIPPASPDGATLDIRRFFDIALTGEDYIRLGSMSPDMLDFLRKAVQAKSSIIVSGGTGTGKTTLLNMLSGAIPHDELIITIEDSCELKLESPNVRRLETRAVAASNKNETSMNVDIRALVKTSLRMRPDRIVVGEIRDGTITDMISAMSTGHEGSMCTVHANSAVNLVRVRLPMLYSMSDTAFSEESQNIQIAEAIDLIVQIKRYGKLRAIQSITEVTGMKDGRVEITDIFRYDDQKKEYYATGYVPKKILDRMLEKGIYIDKDIFKSREMKKKEELEAADAEAKEEQDILDAVKSEEQAKKSDTSIKKNIDKKNNNVNFGKKPDNQNNSGTKNDNKPKADIKITPDALKPEASDNNDGSEDTFETILEESEEQT